MNRFLQNLIVRHQASGENLEANHIVKPRPKSRFETESNADSFISPSDSGIEETITSFSEQPLMNPQKPAVHQAETDKKNPVVDIGLTDIEPSLFEEIRLMKKKSSFTAQNGNIQILSISDELQPRVQTILHRLNSQQSQQFDQTSATELQQDNSVSNNVLTGSEELSVKSEQTLDFDQKGQVTENLANRSEQWSNQHEESHQSGLLQIPDWLTQIQSELNQRQKEINTLKNSDSVVNVTIGRVEVRAVQADNPKPSKSQNKPSGIMTLDNYLKQRDKGRA